MWLKKGLIGLFFVYSGLTYAENSSLSYNITIKALKAHVAFLSSEVLAGRLTGTKGEQLATQYAADLFKQLDLKPAGDNGTFFQKFNFTAGVALGKNNSLSITDQNGSKKTLILNKDWRPLSFSSNQSFEINDLVFAGYGIKAPSAGHLPAYNSYQHLNVKNKWVIVFRYAPEKLSTEEHRQLMPYSSLRYKAFIAKEQGAKGIIFVSGPNSKVTNELVPLSFDTSLSHSGIGAISVSDQVVNTLLIHTPNSLQNLQDKLDSSHQLDATVALTHIKLAGQIDIEQTKRQGRNVLALLQMSKATPMIIMGAHIDHLGRGGVSASRSRQNEKNLIHYGADDNASGVAAILEASVKLADMQKKGSLHGNKNILFALWSGEELGLLGSTHFINKMIEKTGKKALHPTIDAYINLDMIGRLKKKFVLQGVGSSSYWLKLINQTNQKHSMSLITQNDPYLPTDSTTFYLHGVPALNLFTGSHDEYHTPRDQASLLNFEWVHSWL